MWKLVVTAVAASLLLLEIGIRLVAAWDRNHIDQVANPSPVTEDRELTLGEIIRPVDDESIVYALRPGIRGRFLGRRLATSSLGFRDPERPIAKPSRTIRIVGLGDSHMFGWGIDRDETFLAVLERKLSRSLDRWSVEAWNLAVPGYNSVQEAATFARTAPLLEPDVVIINWVGNDADLPNFLTRRPDVWSLERSFLHDLARRRLRILRGKVLRPFGLVEVPFDGATGRTTLDENAIPEEYRHLVGAENMNAAYGRLARTARAKGAHPVVVFDWNDPTTDAPGIAEFKKSREAEGYLVVDTRDHVLQFLETEGWETRALWISDRDPHPNPIRHRLIAEALLDALEPRLRRSGRPVRR